MSQNISQRLMSMFRRRSSFLEGEAFHAPIRQYIDGRLEGHGFVNFRGLKWVEEYSDPMRKVFEIRFSKGGLAVPQWGYSLNYVPHVNCSGTTVYWHRTPKTAKLDVGPFLHMDSRPVLEQFISPEEHLEQVNRVLGSAICLAFEYFDCIKTLADLLYEFESLSRNPDPTRYWYFENLPLAHAFTLAFCGKPNRGLEILRELMIRRQIGPDAQEKLVAAYETVEPNRARAGI